MKNKHLIKKHMIEVISNDASSALALQHDTERLCRDELSKGLEDLFDRYAPESDLVQIDRLYVEIEGIQLANFEEEFSKRILEELESALVQTISRTSRGGTAQRKSGGRRPMELLVCYLDCGYLPWWSTLKSTPDWKNMLEELVVTGKEEPEQWALLKKGLASETSRRRLIAEFSEDLFWKIAEQIGQESVAMIRSLRADLDVLVQFGTVANGTAVYDSAGVRELVLQTLIGTITIDALYEALTDLSTDMLKGRLENIDLNLLHNNAFKVLLIKRIRKTSVEQIELKSDRFSHDKSGHTDDNSTPSPLQQQEAGLPLTEAGKKYAGTEIYIANSGLVILAAYLPVFFERMGLLLDGKLKNADRGLALLHYLVYGNDEFAGFETVLSKVLCGLELDAVIHFLKLEEEEKQEADLLLGSVISHWQVLKSTSENGLRASFLQREGKLVFQDGIWKLIVQRAAHDMLLSYLPWSIHLVKLPWMRNRLQVDWN